MLASMPTASVSGEAAAVAVTKRPSPVPKSMTTRAYAPVTSQT